jgi:glycosyltransferase involved in cell wall biosynthesis
MFSTALLGKQWLHVVSHLDPKYGGLSSVVPQLNSAIASLGEYSVHLTGFCQSGEYFVPKQASHVKVDHLPLGRREWITNSGLKQRFRRQVSSSIGVHVHGLWQQSSAVAAPFARNAGKPYLISAHGMLEAWALRNKRWKKSLYMALFERTNLRYATCLHALTQAEAEDYRRLGLHNPIAVIPNGVEIPANISHQKFLHQFPSLQNKRLILFLGRIHFKKGLDILCQAWARLSAKWPDAHLVLAGPDFEGTQTQVEQLIAALNLTPHVTFTGMLTGELKWSALATAEAFVLPSYSEGLSVSVLEAMGAARPIIITENCNLPEVAHHGCGWVIKPNTAELEAALNDLLRSSSAELNEMGMRGKQLVANRYSWEVVGKQMSSLYRWVENDCLPADVEIQFHRRSR